MVEYPLVYKIMSKVIEGYDWTAVVSVCGRALMYREDDQWWMGGVELGGVVACGITPVLANHAFTDTYNDVLADIAEDSLDFAAFKREVERLFHDKNADTASRWEVARKAIRKGQLRFDAFVEGCWCPTYAEAARISVGITWDVQIVRQAITKGKG